MRNEVEKLRTEKLLQGDEIRALKAEIRSYQDEMGSLSDKVQCLEGQALRETPARIIGKEVRLRFLERHRKRMKKSIGPLGHERIRGGDRAAHRGRPVVDALLCLTGEVTDHGVYTDLYGVSPELMEKVRDIPEIIEITGFRASLQSEGIMTKEFEVLFQRVFKLANTYFSPTDLRGGFGGNKALQQLQGEIQNCFDKTIAAHPRGNQDPF